MTATTLSWNGNPAMKAATVIDYEQHMKADKLRRGQYWQSDLDGEFRGCAVGCLSHRQNNPHEWLADKTGIPKKIFIMIDGFFENTTETNSQTIVLNILKAIPVGVDLENSLLFPKFFHWLMIDPTHGVVNNVDERYPEAKTAILDIAAAYAREIAGEILSAEEWSNLSRAADSAADRAADSAADSAADRAADSAADSAAYSAADSAADRAAYSAAYSAADRAAYRAADSAADSAADRAAYRAAYSAAYSAAYRAADRAADSAADRAAHENMYDAMAAKFTQLLREIPDAVADEKPLWATQIDSIVNAHKSGVSYSRLAKRFYVTSYRVRKICASQGAQKFAPVGD